MLTFKKKKTLFDRSILWPSSEEESQCIVILFFVEYGLCAMVACYGIILRIRSILSSDWLSF